MGGLISVESLHALGKNQFGATFQYGVKQSLLGSKIIMRKGGVKVGQDRHFAHRHTIKTTLRKQILGRVENAIGGNDTAIHLARSTHRRAFGLCPGFCPPAARRTRRLATVTSDAHARSRMTVQLQVAHSIARIHKLLKFNFSHSNSFQLHS